MSERAYQIKTLDQLRKTPNLIESREGTFIDMSPEYGHHGMVVWTKRAEESIPDNRCVVVDNRVAKEFGESCLGIFDASIPLYRCYSSIVASITDDLKAIREELHD